ncbi:MAG: hypothetical protein FGM55_06755 [Rhodoferax sp.]|nr:hypothetical protein [Rhodoferax sp.]
MSTALWMMAHIVAPLGHFWQRCMPLPSAQTAPLRPGYRPACSPNAPLSARRPKAGGWTATDARGLPGASVPLRVRRIVEADQSAHQAGRMVISGRMADVCAELDRLALRSSRRH